MSFKQSILIEFDGGFVRPLNLSDVHPEYVDGLNDPDVNRFLVSVKERRQTLESVADFVKRSVNSENEILFGIWINGSALHRGTIRLHEIESPESTAIVGVCIFDKRAWGHGLGTKAIVAVTRWAHEILKIREVEACAYVENLASQKTFVSAGYEHVADIRDKYLFEGRPTVVKRYVSSTRD